MAEITINLDELYGGESPFPQALVTEAARLALRTWTAPGPEGEQSEIPTALGRRIEEQVADVIREDAAAAAPKIVEQVLDEGVRLTDHYGSPKGERTPLRTVIAQRVEQELYDGQTGRKGGGVLAEMIGHTVKRQLQEELQGALDKAKADIQAVHKEASVLLAQSVEGGLGRLRV
jgi:hypothetical protein